MTAADMNTILPLMLHSCVGFVAGFAVGAVAAETDVVVTAEDTGGGFQNLGRRSGKPPAPHKNYRIKLLHSRKESRT